MELVDDVLKGSSQDDVHVVIRDTFDQQTLNNGVALVRNTPMGHKFLDNYEENSKSRQSIDFPWFGLCSVPLRIFFRTTRSTCPDFEINLRLFCHPFYRLYCIVGSGEPIKKMFSFFRK